MSSFEQIFLDPGTLSTEQASTALARALRLSVTWIHDDWTLTGTAADAELPAPVGGTLGPNIYAEDSPSSLEEVSIYDSLPLVFELRTTNQNWELQGDIAWVLYTRMVEHLQWTSALTSEYTELIATFDRERGLRTFDPGTSSEGTDAHLWQ